MGKNTSLAVSNEERINALKEAEMALKRQIVYCEIDIRYIERQKLSIGKANLANLEVVLTNKKSERDALDGKLEVVLDTIKELSVK
jgi:hypothetical protein